jgi:hypothetical protein
MALPFLAPLLIPQFPKKKLLQMSLCGKDNTPVPEPAFLQVPSHNLGSGKVGAHMLHNYSCQIPWQQEKSQDHQIQEEARTI